MLIHKKKSLPYHAYRISHMKLLSQIFSVTQGVCSHQILLQYMIHHFSAQSVANLLIEIQQLLKKVPFFMVDNNTQKMMTSNETRLTFTITYIIIYEGLSFNLSQKPRFKKVLDLARTVSKLLSTPQQKSYI